MNLALSLSLALVACTASFSNQLPPMSSEGSPQHSVISNNSSWRLERWERQGSVVALVSQTEVYLSFQNNQVNGFAGCNNFAGPFSLKGNQLSVGTLNATQKGCVPDVMNQETQFLSALQSGRRIGSDALGRLLLFYELDSGEGVLYFAPRN